MEHVQAHPGPDDSGLWEQRFPDGSYIGLGSRRLAILDLSPSGHMPMANEDRSLIITHNGEVYNFAELRRELQAKGYRFSSETDTEVVLHRKTSKANCHAVFQPAIVRGTSAPFCFVWIVNDSVRFLAHKSGSDEVLRWYVKL